MVLLVISTPDFGHLFGTVSDTLVHNYFIVQKVLAIS